MLVSIYVTKIIWKSNMSDFQTSCAYLRVWSIFVLNIWNQTPLSHLLLQRSYILKVYVWIIYLFAKNDILIFLVKYPSKITIISYRCVKSYFFKCCQSNINMKPHAFSFAIHFKTVNWFTKQGKYNMVNCFVFV